jgi:hydroxyacylglutathione hydrolase
MILQTLVVGLLQTNCYIVGEQESGQAAIIDPGHEALRIVKAAQSLEVRYVINTHAHFDHMQGNAQVLEALARRQETPPELVAHPDAAPLLAACGGASMFGFEPVRSPAPDRLVKDRDTLTLGQLSFEVLHTPGHSPGSISLYCATEKVVFAGDVLFRQGVGRTDLPGGSWPTLMDSITRRLFTLPDDTAVYPGHGMPTRIGLEKRDNPFIS